MTKQAVTRRNVIVNFVLFQAAWFACVLGSAQGLPWLAVAFVVCVVVGQSFFAPSPLHALKLASVACGLGACVDQAFLMCDIVQYQSHGWSAAIVPVWIIALWMAFASTLNVSLRWLHDQVGLQCVFGAIGGPLAYIGAEKLGAVTVPPTVISYVVLGFAWAVMTVILFKLAKVWDLNRWN